VTTPNDHWDRIYQTRSLDDVSWYQPDTSVSVRLIEMGASGRDCPVVDIGSGGSVLVDQLLAQGFADITLVDVSELALEKVRTRLGDRAQHVRFISHDLLTWAPERRFDVWHDRAVFHFLTKRSDRDRYIELATNAIDHGGALVLGTFAEDGPTQCSGLAVCRYSAQVLGELFSESFALVAHEREEHVTPAAAVQPFTWVLLRRSSSSVQAMVPPPDAP
jgi:2-polyprenyl-3-methyl-5-hydroxy-6-metoxy-1,4-benzoquinol methylase